VKKIPCLSVREFDSHDAFTLTDQVTAGCGWALLEGRATVKWHREAWGRDTIYPDVTYELVGPKVQSNPYGRSVHELLAHGCVRLIDVPRDYDGIRAWLAAHEVEGIVWHHHDGRMVKIKRRDFGLTWPPKKGAP